MPDQYRRATAAQRESWDLTQYVLQHNRENLMARFNEVVGSPSYAVAIVQYEFVSGRMESDEMADYAQACCEIIFSIETTSGIAIDPIGEQK